MTHTRSYPVTNLDIAPHFSFIFFRFAEYPAEDGTSCRPVNNNIYLLSLLTKIMSSIKVKFRPSTVNGKEGTIYYQVIQNRVIRQIKTDYHIFSNEWDRINGRTIISQNGRSEKLLATNERIAWDLKRLKDIIHLLENSKQAYTAEDIVHGFMLSGNNRSFSQFMRQNITMLRQMGKNGTADTYMAAFRSFMRFRKDKDVIFEEINSDMMLMYEAYLHHKGVIRNTSSFYMRTLRAVYNRAVEKGLTEQCHPFKHVYTGIDKTVKRAIPLEAVRRIRNIDLSQVPTLDFARDIFLLSFYTRGMSFVDLAFLKKKDLRDGVLTYRRRKTGQPLAIKWEQCMQNIIDKHKTDADSPYLLPIIKQPEGNTWAQYKSAMIIINKRLKKIAGQVNIPTPLTLYVARHTWASAAKYKNIPISVISESMGHDSELTTQIYLASLDNTIVDNANKLIINSI